MAATQDDLQALLGRGTAGLDTLSAADRQKLAAAIRSARRIQEDEYRDAFDKALSHVPALLRGTIRRMIAG